MTTTMASTEDQHAVKFGREALAEDVLEELHLAQQLGTTDHHDRSNRDPDERAHAAKHHDRENDRRLQEDEALRRHEALACREERAGEAAEHRTDGKRP